MGGGAVRPTEQLVAPLEVQVFGFRDSRPTQRALRFFRERRVPMSFVDLARRPLAAGELRRFIERLGAAQLVDGQSPAYRDGGLAWLSLDADQLGARLLSEPRLLPLPLVRAGSRCTAGDDERSWRSWLAGAG